MNAKESYDALQKSLCTQVLPCPYCGSSDIYVGHANAFSFHCSCMKCGASGPPVTYSDTIIDDWDGLDSKLLKDAFLLWNKRHDIK